MGGRRGRALLLAASLGALLYSAASAGALELQDGRLRLLLHEGSGRFSLYLRSAGEDGKDLALLAADDPRTSSTTLFVENRMYRLGDSPEFRGKAAKSTEGLSFFWESGRLRATMSFSPISSRPDGERNAVLVRLRLRNLTQSTLSVGARLLLDTWLGEDGAAHFVTNRGQEIGRETSVPAAGALHYWTSLRERKGESVGLECLVAGGQITRPDRVVFANWKRLSDTVWMYDTTGSRNFSHAPYSINDSAVSLYYDPRPLAPASEREVAVVLGEYDPAGYVSFLVAATKADATGADSGSGASGEGDAALRGVIERGLQDLDVLIREIDARLASDTEPAADDLRALEKTLDDLTRKAEELPRSP